MAKKRNMKRFWRGLLALGAVFALGALGLLGWQWLSALRVERIDVSGARHAPERALLELARVDTGQVMLDVDPALVADRVRRHPWVAAARATRLPTGTLAIRVQERVTVLLVLDAKGRPAHYLDRDGFAMPLTPDAAYDVPLLRGFGEAYHPVRRVQDPAVRDLLVALAEADDDTDALASELEREPSGEIVLHTTPAGARGSILVRLGRDDMGRKLARLRAFWQQAVLTQPEKAFTSIDLRFDSQVVTQEDVRGQ